MISIKMNEAEENMLKELAESEGIDVSEYVQKIIDEKLEDLYGLKIGEEALEEYRKDPKTFTMDEVFKG